MSRSGSSRVVPFSRLCYHTHVPPLSGRYVYGMGNRSATVRGYDDALHGLFVPSIALSPVSRIVTFNENWPGTSNPVSDRDSRCGQAKSRNIHRPGSLELVKRREMSGLETTCTYRLYNVRLCHDFKLGLHHNGIFVSNSTSLLAANGSLP
jgi:hypothetical protein